MRQWKQQAKKLKQEIYTLYYACRDNRLAWPVKILAIILIAYAFSPIDLIPDFIPILGYLDDLVLIPLGIFFIFKFIPKKVIEEARKKAELASNNGLSKPKNWLAAGIIICLWFCCGILIILKI